MREYYVYVYTFYLYIYILCVHCDTLAKSPNTTFGHLKRILWAKQMFEFFFSVTLMAVSFISIYTGIPLYAHIIIYHVYTSKLNAKHLFNK